jgi:hypothetical protein
MKDSSKAFEPPVETDHVSISASILLDDADIYLDVKSALARLSESDKKELELLEKYRRLCDYLSVSLSNVNNNLLGCPNLFGQ